LHPQPDAQFPPLQLFVTVQLFAGVSGVAVV